MKPAIIRKGGNTDEKAKEGITKLIFAEYRTDNHATAQDEPKHNAATRVSGAEDGQVPVAGTAMNQYIITEEGIGELEKYFMEHKDDLFRIAWKNFKDKHIHPYNPQAEREKIADALKDFDMWFSMRHVCGQSPIIPEVRQELHRRMRELRQGKEGE